METAKFGHISRKYCDAVYEPSEDTFLLLDALEVDREELLKYHVSIVLEVGSGSGVVIASLAKFLGNDVFYIGTDINSDANLATKETAAINNVMIEAVNTDLVNGFSTRLKGAVDILIFNPPYVPTEDDELTKTKLSASWAGGCNGRRVMDRFFPNVDNLLSPIGVFYLVAVKENRIEEIRQIMSNFNFSSEIVLERKHGPEHLSVLKFKRKLLKS